MIAKIYEIFRRHPHISTDTRRITQGSIFFALRGASFDGNDFALQALEAGAAYSVVDREGLAGDNPKVIYVDDALTALQQLATLHRRTLGIPIIAITGSNGKTTTKELLTAVLSKKYRTTATVGNFNNHIGVPLTLLSMETTTEMGVVEMGANAQGEIAMLCEIAEPNFGIINNIGRAHLLGFGGVDGIRKGKGELFDYLQSTQGIAFVAQDDEVLMEMSHQRTSLDTVEYPITLANDINHQLEGDYNLKNIAAAVAIATYFRVEKHDINSAIANYTPQNNRSQRLTTPHNTVIIDCYNANPSSMEVSIKNFQREESRSPKVLILGDMFELGEWSEVEHQQVIQLAVSDADAEVILVGENFTLAYNSLNIGSERVTTYPTRAELEHKLTLSPILNSMILLKGSHSVGLEHIIKML